MNRDSEICQMALEDECSSCLLLKTKMEKEEIKTQDQYQSRNESQVVTLQEQRVDD